LARLLPISGRAAAATAGSWEYVRPSRVICAEDASEVPHCLHDPDAMFIARLLEQLQVGQDDGLGLSGRLLDRLLVLRGRHPSRQPPVQHLAVAG
jgi:hypothetical protein